MSTRPEHKHLGHGAEIGGVGDPSMRAAIVSVFVCGVCFALVALALFGARAALGVFIGGTIATGNLFVFARLGQAMIARKGNTAPWSVVAVLKLLLLFCGVWIILRSGVVSGLSLAVGYAALPFGVTFASLFGPQPGASDPPSIESARRGQDVIKRRRSGPDDGSDA